MTMNEEQQRLLWIGAFRYYAERRFHCSFHAFCELIHQEWPSLSSEVRRIIQSELNLCFAHDDPGFDKVRSLWTDEGK